MGLVTNGTRFSQTEIPNRKFPNFFVNGKRPLSQQSQQVNSTVEEYSEDINLVPRVLSLLRESTVVTAGHVSARF